MDRSLLHAFRSGDPRAQRAVGRWLFDELAVFFKRHPSDQLDELVQESAQEIISEFAKAPDELAAFRDWVRGFAGMRARAINRDLKRQRARIVDGSPCQTLVGSPSAGFMRPLFEIEERELVLHHAQRLRPIYCNALMHVLDGGDYKSLAASEGIPEGTAWHRLAQAKKLVRQSIKTHRRTRPSCRTPAVP